MALGRVVDPLLAATDQERTGPSSAPSPPPSEDAIHWRANGLRLRFRRRAQLSLVVSVGLFLGVLELDALPLDVDLPGIPDLELAHPWGVLLATSLVIVLSFLYASWLLYANSPVRLGFHRGGLVVAYRRGGARLARSLWSSSAPRLVPWKEVRAIGDPLGLRLSRHDLLLERTNGRPWVLVGLSPELLQEVRRSFQAQLEIAQHGSWRGFVPVAMGPSQGEHPETA